LHPERRGERCIWNGAARAASDTPRRMPPMRIDAHQHFWHYDAAEYAWIDDTMPALRRNYTPDDLQLEMAAAGFDRSIAVQARQSLDETRALLAHADAHPFVAGVVGWVDLASPAIDAQLEDVAAHPRLVGVRHVVQSEPDGFLASEAFRQGVSRLERHGLTYDLLIYARQLPEAVELVKAFPDQRFVLDHLGKPDVKTGGMAAWRAPFEKLAAFPNVWCKLSGLVTEADWHAWTPGQLQPFIDAALESFGPDRLMIGSDWPVCTLAGAYARVMAVMEDALAGCSTRERASVLGGTAQRVWNL
jgi:L-fuconolactonase